MLKEKKLYTPDAEEDIKIWGGSTSNVLDLSNIPKSSEVFHKYVDVAYNNNWLPHKTSMSEDAYDYKHKLSEDEKYSYNHILSFLAFLDSIQTNNLPNIANWVTDPNFVYALARQAWDEAVHSKSYGWIFSSVMTKNEAKAVYDLSRKSSEDNKLLIERNRFIASIYQEFVDKPSERNFVRALIANYMLEGVYFYNGFKFFHNLSNRNLMIGTGTQISYIERDELVHTQIFKTAILNLFNQNIGFKDKYHNMIQDMFKEAVQWEIEFSHEFIGDRVLGISKNSITDYTHFLGNRRLDKIGIGKVFPDVKNPYTHLEKSAGVEDETSNRSNNFEVNGISYKSPEILTGWDNI